VGHSINLPAAALSLVETFVVETKKYPPADLLLMLVQRLVPGNYEGSCEFPSEVHAG
jgi:hypothetical protein